LAAVNVYVEVARHGASREKDMKHRYLTLTAIVPAAAFGQGSQEIYRYEFGIQVFENEIADNGIGGELATLSVGTAGVLTMDVNPDDNVFPSDLEYVQVYQILDLGISVGGVTSGATPGVYPSANGLTDSFIVENDHLVSQGTQLSDSIGTVPAFEHPEMGLSLFAIVQRITSFAGFPPDMIDSIDAPLAIDTSFLTSVIDFSIYTQLPGPNSRVKFNVTGVQVTVIPAPASIALLGISGIAIARRRRKSPLHTASLIN
jgi:hypothetical protein